MLKKYLTQISRPLGQLLIFSFAISCIFFSLIVRDIKEHTLWGKIVNYTVSFENRFYDFRMNEEINPNFQSKEQVLVKLDDYTLAKIKTYPLPREKHAELLDKLRAHGAKVVAMDILFPEAAPVCGANSPDERLVKSFNDFHKDGRSVVIGLTTDPEGESLAEVPEELLYLMPNVRSEGTQRLKPTKIVASTFPIEAYYKSGIGLGTINSEEDRDGIFRHYTLVSEVEGTSIGSLGLNAYDFFVDTPAKAKITVMPDGDAILNIKKKKMELSSTGETKIRYVGGLNQFPSVSYYDVLISDENDVKMKQLLAGKLVFIGSTAIGAHDLRPSPIDPKMPGVFAHMNIAHMLLHQYFYKPEEKSVQYSYILLVLGMLIFFFIQRLNQPAIELGSLIAMIAFSYYLDRIYFLPEGYELKLFYCYLCFAASYFWNTFLNFSEANKEKKQIKGTFARYVAPTIVDEMLKDPEKLVVGGFRRDITCLFSDVRDFTSISEGLSASELAHSLNIYMGKMTDIVMDSKGTLDKYIGDAIVAFWGAPLEVGNHAQLAVEGAIKMMEVLPAINEQFIKMGRPIFNIGIGLNSGECNVGNMGSDRIFSYTALGDNMNLGARLESLCKHYGTQILISEFTLKSLDLTRIKVRPIDNVVVKGKKTAVAVYEVLHANHFMTKNPEDYATYNNAHAQFISKDFKVSATNFQHLTQKHPEDKASKRFYELSKKFLEHPELVTQEFYITVMTEK